MHKVLRYDQESAPVAQIPEREETYRTTLVVYVPCAPCRRGSSIPASRPAGRDDCQSSEGMVSFRKTYKVDGVLTRLELHGGTLHIVGAVV
jgi:hypothetical protein